MSTDPRLELPFIVECRSSAAHAWRSIAAFDVHDIADQYAQAAASKNPTAAYRCVQIETTTKRQGLRIYVGRKHQL